MRLADKVCLITGGGGNIGLATARVFLAEGGTVVLVDSDREALDRALSSLAGVARVIVADVTSEAEVARYVDETVTAFGPIDVFFNNAAIEGAIGALPDFSVEDYESVMAVNVRGVFLGMKHVPPRMTDGGSAIITSSIMGLVGNPRSVAYAASKHAVVGIMRSAAIQYAERRIRVNTVRPGPVDSDMMRRIEQKAPIGAAAVQAANVARLKLGRYVSPRDVAETVLFLASDESRMITGQTIAVDGGYLL